MLLWGILFRGYGDNLRFWNFAIDKFYIYGFDIFSFFDMSTTCFRKPSVYWCVGFYFVLQLDCHVFQEFILGVGCFYLAFVTELWVLERNRRGKEWKSLQVYGLVFITVSLKG